MRNQDSTYTIERIKTLTDEFIAVSNHGFDLLITQYTVAAGVLAVGAYLYSKERNKNKVGFEVAMPFILIAIVCTLLYNYDEIISMGGYRQALGERLNNLLKEDVFNWENFARKTFQHSNNYTLIQSLIYIGILLATIINSILKLPILLNSYNRSRFIKFVKTKIGKGFSVGQLILALIYLVIFVFLIKNVHDSYGIYDRAYEYFKNKN